MTDKRWNVENGRYCRFCGQPPTKEGHDACLQELPGVLHACCGHGVEPSMVRFNNRIVIRGQFDSEHLHLTEEQKRTWEKIKFDKYGNKI